VEFFDTAIVDGDAEVLGGAVTTKFGVHLLDVEGLREGHGMGFAITSNLNAQKACWLPHDGDVVALGVRLEEVSVGDST